MAITQLHLADVDAKLLLRAAGALAVAGIVRFFYRLYRRRTLVRKHARENGIPLLPHSFLLGHIPLIAKIMTKEPMDINGQMAPLFLAREYPEVAKHGLLYMDVWPMSEPMLAVFHPDLMAQFTQEHSRPKHPLLHFEFGPFTQCKDLVTSDGEAWRRWRSIFNPGFSAKNILALVPDMLEEVQVFVKWLEGAAKSGKTVELEAQAMKLTIDVIGRAVLGSRLHSQTEDNPLYLAMKSQVAWIVNQNDPPSILRYYNPLRLPMMWWHNRVMRNYITPHIQRAAADYDSLKGPKTINSLAVKSYLEGDASEGLSSSAAMIDPSFVDVAVAHIKIFLFAGHDTTATTLAFAYYLLHRNPSTLAALRAEHDAFLGSDPRAAADAIIAKPGILNQLTYTSAVIKETLRFYPPVGTIRSGAPDFFLQHPTTGQRYPTDGWMLFGCSFAEQRMAEFWERPDEFLPERWLAREGEPLHVRKNAFRPFELGPRNCIGQELAQVELRMILALTARHLDIAPAYPAASPKVFGEQGYQVSMKGEITAHSKDGMPVKVALLT